MSILFNCVVSIGGNDPIGGTDPHLPLMFQKKWVEGSNHIGTHPLPPPRFFKVLTQGQFLVTTVPFRQTPDEVEDPSPRYVHIPELMSLKTDMPNKVGQALVDGGEHGGCFPILLKKEITKKRTPEKRA